jgi:hypothetical protein
MITPDPTARAAQIANLEAEARCARERFDDFKAELEDSRLSRPNQLRKLQEACRYAEARLDRAREAT